MLGLLGFVFTASGLIKTISPEEKLIVMMTFLDDTILEVKHLKLLGIAEVAGGLTVAVTLFSEIVPSELVITACACFGMTMVGATWFTWSEGMKAQIPHFIIFALSAISTYQLL